MTVELRISDWMPLATGLDAGHRVCAVGDVHGNNDKLLRLLNAFAESSPGWTDTTLVVLGDLHDRGRDGIAAIDSVIATRDGPYDEVYPLMGNHEQMMRRFTAFGTHDDYERWEWNGARSVLHEPLLALRDSRRWRSSLREALIDALGPERMDFLESLHSHARLGNLLFVHAGIEHSISIEENFDKEWSMLDENHWAWIRRPFLMHPVVYADLCVVHGHSPVTLFCTRGRDPERAIECHFHSDGKINLDAGSFMSGRVAAGEFARDRYRILTAVGKPSLDVREHEGLGFDALEF